MIVREFFTPGLSIASYLIFDAATRKGALIDPTRHIEQYLGVAKRENVTITHILETHVHADFVSGAKELKEALAGNATIACSIMGGKEWYPAYSDRQVKDKEEIIFGKTRLQAWHTPGHTPEHLMWVAFDDVRNEKLPVLSFTGDLLFVGSIGRPDLLGKATEELLAKQLYATVFETLSTLPDFLEVYPAHSAGSLCGKGIGERHSSTLGYERLCNPWLIKQPFETWVRELSKDIPIAPPYFKLMKELNVTGINLENKPHELPPLLTLEETLKLLPSCQVVDVRGVDAFSAGHLKQAIHLPLSVQFTSWAGAVLPFNKDLLVVVNDVNEAMFVIQSLKLIGIDKIKGVCNAAEWHQPNWKEVLHPSPQISVEEVKKNETKTYILDVRTPAEWNLGHIQEAHHIEMADIASNLERIPKEDEIAVFCHSGTRASIITSLLQTHGLKRAKSVKGGMVAWKEAGF